MTIPRTTATTSIARTMDGAASRPRNEFRHAHNDFVTARWTPQALSPISSASREHPRAGRPEELPYSEKR